MENIMENEIETGIIYIIMDYQSTGLLLRMKFLNSNPVNAEPLWGFP